MYSYCILLFLFSNVVFCWECITEDFERGLRMFNSNTGTCHRIPGPMWVLRQYSSVNISSPHPSSTSFVSLRSTWTCMASSRYVVSSGGRLEMSVYTTSTAARMNIEEFEFNPTGEDWFRSGSQNVRLVLGWQTLSRQTHATNGVSMIGYFTVSGQAPSTAILLIDSIRYISPTFDRNLCVVYEEPRTTTTTTTRATTTTTTPAPTTTTTTTTPAPTTTTTTTTPAPTTTTTTTTPVPTTTEVLATTTLVPSTTTDDIPITTTAHPTASTATTPTATEAPATQTEVVLTTTEKDTTPATATTPSASTNSPRLSISIHKIFRKVNAKIIKYFR